MKIALLSAFLFFFSATLFGQGFVANYDEDKMPAYTLPDALIFRNGLPVKNHNDWEKIYGLHWWFPMNPDVAVLPCQNVFMVRRLSGLIPHFLIGFAKISENITGKHAITIYDWGCFMNFTDGYFKKK
ncbi:MAG: hypothetical protein M0Q53_01105 [Prolixibacteraceae bacterium]|jgi:hypothetical protein|nr:hypothetical protein [Prolixibacteraceae bacterium]